MDESRLRLRASCNACNESKVRCSHCKPTCTRCERNQIECVYGLSRRTHKDAPPIPTNPSQRGQKHSRPGRPSRLSSNGDTRATTSATTSNSTRKITTPFNDCAMPDEPVDSHNNNNANFMNDYLLSMADEPDMMYDTSQLLDYNSLVTNDTNDASGMAMTSGFFSTAGIDFANFTEWDSESLFGTKHNSNTIDMGGHQARSSNGECTCHAGVGKLLASMGDGGNSQRLSLDAQLAKLKQCNTSSETSMACTHGRDDSEPMHIMAVAMLIGHVIDEFEMLASESSPRMSSASVPLAAKPDMATLGTAEMRNKSGTTTPGSINMSLGVGTEPRLSWGVLELEEDDEMDLRQRLYLLSFRKLERLLSQLTLCLKELHNTSNSLPDPSRHMAFVIACDYTRLWLGKKAGDVKRLFSVPARDETTDATL